MLQKNHELYDSSSLNQANVKSWISNGPDSDLLKAVDNFGRDISKKVSTSQLRQIFAKMKSIEAKGGLINKKGQGENKTAKIELLMLKPLMAYASGRHSSIKRLVERLDWAIDEVLAGKTCEKKQERFRNFCKLFESILAYHRKYGGK